MIEQLFKGKPFDVEKLDRYARILVTERGIADTDDQRVLGDLVMYVVQDNPQALDRRLQTIEQDGRFNLVLQIFEELLIHTFGSIEDLVEYVFNQREME